MNKLLFLLLFFFPFGGFAQSCDCHEALNFTVDLLKNSPSYKEQIKRNAAKTSAFNKEILSITERISRDPLIESNCLAYLSEVLALVRDGHLYAVPAKDRTLPKKEEDPEAFEAFMQSSKVSNLPVYEGDIEALEDRLQQTEFKALEGIYTDVNSVLEIGVIQQENGFRGIILNSESNYWLPGHVIFEIQKRNETTFSGYYYDTYRDTRYTVESSPKRMIDNWGIWKDLDNRSPWLVVDRMAVEPIQPLEEGVLYLYLASFKGTTENIRRMNGIYEEVGTMLPNIQHLIIDVRNNGGGGQVSYNRLLEKLKAYEDQLQVHIVMNRKTGSAAEIFSAILKEKGAIWYGENTRGALEYRYSNKFNGKDNGGTVPCWGYRLGITVAKTPAKLRALNAEVIGLTPDVYLSDETEWRTQVLTSILREKEE
ncbi:MAG: hypothetical protein AAF598_07735 [Bacteroidota bacterium]